MLLRRLRLLTLIVVLGLVFAACGDSGDGGDGGDGGGSADQPTSTSTAGGLLGGGDDNGIGDVPLTVGDIPGLSDDCEAVANVFLAMVSVFSGGDPRTSAVAIESLPSEIRDDATIVMEAVIAYADGLEAMGVDPANPLALGSLTEAQIAEFEELSELIDTDAFNQASDNLSAYGEAECDDFNPVG